MQLYGIFIFLNNKAGTLYIGVERLQWTDETCCPVHIYTVNRKKTVPTAVHSQNANAKFDKVV